MGKRVTKLYYQVCVRRNSVGQGYWHHRPYPATSEIGVARQNLLDASAVPDMVEAVVLLGDSEQEVVEQYNLYINFKPCRTADVSEDTQRELLEMAPLRDNYDYRRYQPPFHAYSWGAALGPLIRLMDRVQKGALGGKDDGVDGVPGQGDADAAELPDGHSEAD